MRVKKLKKITKKNLQTEGHSTVSQFPYKYPVPPIVTNSEISICVIFSSEIQSGNSLINALHNYIIVLTQKKIIHFSVFIVAQILSNINCALHTLIE